MRLVVRVVEADVNEVLRGSRGEHFAVQHLRLEQFARWAPIGTGELQEQVFLALHSGASGLLEDGDLGGEQWLRHQCERENKDE